MKLSKFKHARKADWVMSFYEGYKTFDGKARKGPEKVQRFWTEAAPEPLT